MAGRWPKHRSAGWRHWAHQAHRTAATGVPQSGSGRYSLPDGSACRRFVSGLPHSAWPVLPAGWPGCWPARLWPGPGSRSTRPLAAAAGHRPRGSEHRDDAVRPARSGSAPAPGPHPATVRCAAGQIWTGPGRPRPAGSAARGGFWHPQSPRLPCCWPLPDLPVHRSTSGRQNHCASAGRTGWWPLRAA